jgi:RNA polymerase sigma-70 factor (ECF subfamily)
MVETSASLLNRLKEGDNEVDWENFYHLYADIIYRYARKLGLNEAGAQDVLQETMVALMSVLKRFEYDPRRGKFRSFLFTIVRRSTFRSINRSKRRNEISADAHYGGADKPLMELLASPEDDSVSMKDEMKWRQSLLEHCVDEVRKDNSVNSETIDIFIAYAVEEKTVQEIAEKFGIKENAVYQIKNRMIKRLQREMENLFPDEETQD